MSTQYAYPGGRLSLAHTTRQITLSRPGRAYATQHRVPKKASNQYVNGRLRAFPGPFGKATLNKHLYLQVELSRI